MNTKKIILTGMRPTGKLHLGHYVGALENWLKLQSDYECFFLIADYQALGDHLGETQKIRESVIDVAMDWMSVGLDFNKNSFVIQSHVPEFAELTMLLSMLVPLALVDRNPTLKAEIAKQKKCDISLGFYSYPVSQAADILLLQADLVPCGDDQLPHIELTREIVRKFNNLYKTDILKEPRELIGRVPRLIGIEGQAKASKSLDNAIFLSDSPQVVADKVRKMYTDPTRIRANDPGHIEGNVVFKYLDVFYDDKGALENLKTKYKEGMIKDVEVKQLLTKVLNEFLDPIREKRAYYSAHIDEVRMVLHEGTERARKIALETMVRIRKDMGITNY